MGSSWSQCCKALLPVKADQSISNGDPAEDDTYDVALQVAGREGTDTGQVHVAHKWFQSKHDPVLILQDPKCASKSANICVIHTVGLWYIDIPQAPPVLLSLSVL